MDDCPQQSCFVPDTGCALGHVDLSACPVYHGSGKDASVPEPTGDVLLPWSGSALGLADLAFVAGRARPRIIATIGPQNAGKTTMLGAWYLLLGRGAAELRAGQFAGSFFHWPAGRQWRNPCAGPPGRRLGFLRTPRAAAGGLRGCCI
ncbi:TRAFAC clade GTPase domain-containing protein [Streptomyces sp. GLT-R25]